MTSIQIFNILHILGAFFLFVGVGGLLGIGENRGNINKLVSILHGIGLVLLLIAGFGLAGVTKIGFPVYVIVKIVLWVGLVALFVSAKKDKISAAAAIWGSLVMGGAALVLCKLLGPVL